MKTEDLYEQLGVRLDKVLTAAQRGDLPDFYRQVSVGKFLADGCVRGGICPDPDHELGFEDYHAIFDGFRHALELEMARAGIPRSELTIAAHLRSPEELPQEERKALGD